MRFGSKAANAGEIVVKIVSATAAVNNLDMEEPSFWRRSQYLGRTAYGIYLVVIVFRSKIGELM